MLPGINITLLSKKVLSLAFIITEYRLIDKQKCLIFIFL